MLGTIDDPVREAGGAPGPRILHAVTSLGIGGAQAMLQRYLEASRHLGVSSQVLSLLPGGDLVPSIAASSDRPPLTLGMRNARFRPIDALRLCGAVRRAAPDLVHGWMYHGNIAASLGATAAFAPVIWSIHHTIADLEKESPLTRRLIRLSAALSRFTSAISYCSRSAADQHERQGFDPRRRHVIPNGTDCGRFRPGDDRRGLLRQIVGIPQTRLIVGHFARYHPMKDQVKLVQAVHRLIGEGHDIQLVIVGEGHQDGPVRLSARAAGIDERVTTLGARHDVDRLIAGIDIYALSSAWGEAFPLAVGEAMASGIPVVSTDVGDAAWLVGPTGAIVPPGDADALAAGLATMIDIGAEGRRALGAAARRRIRDNFSLEQYVNAHLELYEAALFPTGPGTLLRADAVPLMSDDRSA